MTFLCLIYIIQLLQNETETDYDVDEEEEEAEWIQLFQEQGINLALEEAEPQEEPLDDPEDDTKSSMKVLHKLLKQQREELKQKSGTSLDIVTSLANIKILWNW